MAASAKEHLFLAAISDLTTREQMCPSSLAESEPNIYFESSGDGNRNCPEFRISDYKSGGARPESVQVGSWQDTGGTAAVSPALVHFIGMITYLNKITLYTIIYIRF